MAWESLASPFVAIARWIYDANRKSPASPSPVPMPESPFREQIAELEALRKEVKTLAHYLKNRDTEHTLKQMELMLLKEARGELSVASLQPFTHRHIVAAMLHKDWRSLQHMMSYWIARNKNGEIEDYYIEVFCECLIEHLHTVLRELQNGRDVSIVS